MELHSKKLSLGSEGEDVSLLHKELRTLGFDIPPHEVSGASFGLGTRDAVAAFQNSHDLNPTGVVDRETAACHQP